MKRRTFYKRGTCAVLSAAVSVVTLLGQMPGYGNGITARAETTSIDKSVRISTKDVSTFNDTDGDGLGEFQGFGTSLCWWANRIGYSRELTEQAATYFYDKEEGLGLTIGRYNVGGGDNTYTSTEVSVRPDVKKNKKATIMTANSAITPFDGTNMNVSEKGSLANYRYEKCDADFGFVRGDKIGKFDYVGWINGIDDSDNPGSGGNLKFDVNAAETGEYTVKMIFTLTGSENSRGVGLKVERPTVSTETVEVDAEHNEAEAADASMVVISGDEETNAASAETADNSTAEENGDVTPAETNSDENNATADEQGSAVGPVEASEATDHSDEAGNSEASDNSETAVPSEEVQTADTTEASEEALTPETTETSEESGSSDLPENAEEANGQVQEANQDETAAPEAVNTDELNTSDGENAEDAGDSEEATKPERTLFGAAPEELFTTEKYELDANRVNSDVIATGNNERLFRVTFENVKLSEGTNRFYIGGVGHDWTLDFVKMAVIKKGDEGVLPEGADEYEVELDESNKPDTVFAHQSHIVRSDSEVPGYCVDVTKIDENTNPEDFDRYDAECGFAWNYDWDADRNQINVLKAAKEKVSEEEFIAEAFSNSPPYFMTVSGCSSGNEDANKDNLRADSVNAFATYMADVIAHWEANGIHFQSATPMNEPYTNYWGANSDKQEGCHFDQGESQSRILVAFAKKLAENKVNNIILSGTDETSIDTAITSYNKLSDEAKNVISRIDTHTYSGSNRKGLRKLAQESGENLWMSEVDGAFTAGNGAGEMSQALGFSERLIDDLNGLMPSAWIIWDIIDTHISDKDDIAANETASKYEEAYNKYDNSDSLSEWLADNNAAAGKSLWGVAIADHSNQKVVLTKKYYAFGQYSRYIRPGYTLLGSGKGTVAAYDSKGKKLVIVATNTQNADQNWQFDLTGFRTVGENVTAIRTSGTLEGGENWADVSGKTGDSFDTNGRTFTTTVKANSITTYIIWGVEMGDGTEETSEAKTFTEDEIKANDYMLYLVDCGTEDSSVVPNGYKLGLYQSETDREYGTDSVTGLKWGHAEDDDNSIMIQTGSTNGSITSTCWYMSNKISFVSGKSGFNYSFELPKRASDEYEVTVGFKVPSGWGSKKVTVELEGETVARSLSVSDSSATEKTYKTEVKDGELDVFVHNPEAAGRGDDPILSYIIVKAVEGNESHVTTYDSFTGVKGDKIYDNNGVMIQAHGGQVQKFTVNGETKYYWYGEDKTYDMDPVTGIHAYSSTDLYNWTDEGVAFKAIPVSKEDYGKYPSADYTADLSIFDNDEYFRNLYGEYKDAPADNTNEYKNKLEEIYWNIADDRTVMERPKVLYNEKTGKYVMWWHCDGFMPSTRAGGSNSQYGKAMVGIATSDSPAGPFKFVTARKLLSSDDANLGWDKVKGSSRDMNLFKDDDGTAYVIYSSDGNANMYIAKLDESYTGLAADTEGADYGVNYNMIFEGDMREAPALFKYEGRYYLITSGCSGWSPNQASYAVTDDLMKKWEKKGDPCTEDTSKTTYDTQSTCVIPVDAENGKFIYMGDRWNEANLKDSRYVWLPIEFQDGGSIAISKYSDWKIEMLDDMGGFSVKTEIPDTAATVEELKEKLPATIEVLKKNGQTVTSSVTWEAENVKEVGEFSITGTLDSGKKITKNVNIVPSKMIYFFDCAAGEEAVETNYFDKAKSILGKILRSKNSDQPYTEELKAGYTGTLIADDSEKAVNDIGTKNVGNNVFEHGFWAGTNKSIDYVFDLEAGEYTVYTGYMEWWNTSRKTKITVLSDGKELTSKEFTLAKNDSNRVEGLTFEIKDKTSVKVSVSKTGSPDPVLSFIAVTKNSGDLIVEDNKEDNKQEDNRPEDNKQENTKPESNTSQSNKPENDVPQSTKPESNTSQGSTTETTKPQNNKPVDSNSDSNVTPEEGAPTTSTVSDNNPKVNATQTDEDVIGTMLKVKKGKHKGAFRLKLDDGTYAKGFVTYNGKEYYFDKNGYATKGFHKVKNSKYYTNRKGVLAKGFKKINGNKYYFTKTGKMAKGLKQIGNSIYYFGSNGIMRTGKVTIGGKTYTFSKNGKLKAMN